MKAQADFMKTALRLPRALHEAIHAQALAAQRTYNAQLIHLLSQHAPDIAVPAGADMAQRGDQVKLRLPDGMRDHLSAAAKSAKRSLNAEIVLRLTEQPSAATLVMAAAKQQTACPSRVCEAFRLCLEADARQSLASLNAAIVSRVQADQTDDETIQFRQFAGQALQGLCANPGGPFQANGMGGWGPANCTIDQIADTAYELANAMIKRGAAS